MRYKFVACDDCRLKNKYTCVARGRPPSCGCLHPDDDEWRKEFCFDAGVGQLVGSQRSER